MPTYRIELSVRAQEDWEDTLDSMWTISMTPKERDELVWEVRRILNASFNQKKDWTPPQ